MKVKVLGSLYEYDHNTIPNTFDYKEYLLNKRIYYGIKISNINIIDNNVDYLYKIKNKVFRRIQKIDNTGFMMAFILGDKSYIDKDVYKCFQKVGIAHLLALSGMHISLLTGIILFVTKRFNSVVKYLICSLFLFIYGFLVMFPASILRCIVFFIGSAINKVFNLEMSNLKVLFITFVILLLIDVNYVYDTGFWFSFCSVFGILFSHEFISGRFKMIKLSIIAFIFTIPISLYSFYSINLFSIFYNVILIPYISLIVYPLSLLSFFVPSIYKIFNTFIDILIAITNYLASIKSSINLSFNVYEIIIYYLLVILAIKFKKNIFFIMSIMVIVVDIIIPYFDNNAYVYYLDVGQGDSSVVILPNRKDVIMIDTGGVANSTYKVSDDTITFLHSLGINKINLVLTHGDYDHMGDAINVVNNMDVKKVIFNCGTYNELENELISLLNKKKIKYYSCIDKLDKIYFLKLNNYGDENYNSNVIYTEIYDYKFLFMGDADKTREKDILNNYNLANIDVLKVGHHGSKTSSSKEFINVVNPKYSIISVGEKNRYGHPNKDVLKTLKESKIYRTDKDGSIMFKINDNKLKIVNYMP